MAEISEVMISVDNGKLEIDDGKRKFSISVWRLGNLQAIMEEFVKDKEEATSPQRFSAYGTNVSGTVTKVGKDLYELTFFIGKLLVHTNLSARQLQELEREIEANWPKT
jgi:hypothetical protein